MNDRQFTAETHDPAAVGAPSAVETQNPRKIELVIGEVLQGDFRLRRLNLLFVFQVNCPGCFLYGFPVAGKIHRKFGGADFAVLGLSTAFEDFEFNTAANTRLLLEEKKTVGATRAALGHAGGGSVYAQPIEFPVAVDLFTTGTQLATDDGVESVCRTYAQYNDPDETDKDEWRQRVTTHLRSIPKTSATFTLNRMPGTPSFFLFDENLVLLDGWFGHKGEREITDIVETRLRRSE
jgi:hypothetical protein